MKKRFTNKRDEIHKILERCQILHMGLQDESGYFIQPVSYGFIDRNEEITLFFCSKKEGRKMEVFKHEPEVSILIDRLCGYRIDDRHYTPCFESLRAIGRVQEVSGKEKEQALFALLEHCGFQKEEIEFDHILSDPSLGFYKIDLRDVVTKKVL
ncbi:pyridoxamine 5'-phosphate oxidase family protein [Dubosiella newyorkensis]|uniref:pyridoxamine 5'-phosphate oxidase family protein n=1 Tax=Dubosiella newyorkensis TaxID=1862672 RepID=UPI0023F541CC|nr:pyridoxamine 5'-phosphate oxidase family protein [Dubosiella newyorkensis]